MADLHKHQARQEPQSAADDRRVAACLGIAAWKQTAVSTLLSQNGGAAPVFCRSARTAMAIAGERGQRIAIWPSKIAGRFLAAARHAQLPLTYVEDGFLRSCGLGAECHAPLSLVIDHSGMHFDPHRSSDLERLLATYRFDAVLMARAERLTARIVQLGLTKYNLADPAELPAFPAKRLVLVAGQVEDDLSFRLGAAAIKDNIALLARARALEPDAWIVYKPHPDVRAGLRAGYHADAAVLRYAAPT